MKRALDVLASLVGLIILAPAIAGLCWLVWRQDGYSPFYVAPRVGKNGRIFRMVKLRSMIKGADSTGVDSTAANDSRITSVGQFIRKYKFDELIQLWNVLLGDMSLVGPRPNVQRGVALYTDEEKRLLTVRPGITDFASIVFADEGEILRDSNEPDTDYDRLIRPWKSRLGLFYIEKQSFWLDIYVIFLTMLSVARRRAALDALAELLNRLGADGRLSEIARRNQRLEPAFPPGAEPVCGRPA